MLHLDVLESDSMTAAASDNVSFAPFPYRLHEMLEVVEQEGLAHIISWSPDEMDEFIVHRPKLFADQVMPRFFKQTKYKSFQRQLNLYHFRRRANGGILGIYSHPLFRRNNRHLSLKIRRDSKINGVQVSQPTEQCSSEIFQENSGYFPQRPLRLGQRNCGDVKKLPLEQSFPQESSCRGDETSRELFLPPFDDWILACQERLFSAPSDQSPREVIVTIEDDDAASIGTIDANPDFASKLDLADYDLDSLWS